MIGIAAAGALALALQAASPAPEPSPPVAGIRWMDWGRHPFELAASLRRPVLVYLRSADCHLCLAQEEDILSDPEIAKWIAEHGVPVAVDVDLRPDVGARYVRGLVPSIALLLPNGEPIYKLEEASSLERAGGTFTSRQELREYLTATSAYFEAHGKDLVAKARELAEVEARVRSFLPGQAPIDRVAAAVDRIREGADFQHGGFGREFKFIDDAPYRLFRLAAASTGDAAFNRLVLSTASGMLGGAIHDPVEGGFHHYAARRDWSLPALEKRLGVNARALRILVAASSLAPERADLRQGAARTASFIVDRLGREDGSFAFGQQGTLGAADPGTYFTADAQARPALKPPPRLERLLSEPLAEAITALLEASALLDDEALERRALAAVDVLAARLYARGRGVSHHLDVEGEPALQGLLADQVAAIEAFISAYQARGSRDDLDRALDLAGFCRENLRRQESYFVDRIQDRLDVGLLRRALVPYGVNGRMALAFFRLSELTGQPSYRREGESILGALAPVLPRLGWRDAPLAEALMAAAAPAVRVVVVEGPPGEPQDTHALRRRARLLPAAGAVVVPAQAGGSSAPGPPRAPGAYVCRGDACQGPLTQGELLSAPPAAGAAAASPD